jgi:hypothetical protein
VSKQLVYTKSFVASSAGDNTLLTPRASNGRLMVFSVLYNPNADITGEVKIKLGDEVKSGARNPKTGALYGFNHHPNFILGDTGDSLIVNLPDTTAITFDITWREAPDWTSETI